MGSYRNLDAWQLGLDLVDSVFAASGRLPRIEFGLRRQMRDAAISVPSNVAEGYRRKGRRGAYQNHVSIALGSVGELDTQFEVAFRNGLLKREEWTVAVSLIDRMGAILYRLHESLN
jgi:four helix bundle protein